MMTFPEIRLGKARRQTHRVKGRPRGGQRRTVNLLEALEQRTLLSVVPQFIGPITVSVGPNVNVNKETGNQAEERIVVNPTNPDHLIAVSNDLTAAGAVQQPSWYSMDAGKTWTKSLFPNPAGANLVGDPSIVFDDTGRAVFTDLAQVGGVGSGGNVFLASEVSTNGGVSWTSSMVDSSGVSDDKEWITVGPDKLNPGHERFYL